MGPLDSEAVDFWMPVTKANLLSCPAPGLSRSINLVTVRHRILGLTDPWADPAGPSRPYLLFIWETGERMILLLLLEGLAARFHFVSDLLPLGRCFPSSTSSSVPVPRILCQRQMRTASYPLASYALSVLHYIGYTCHRSPCKRGVDAAELKT